MIIYNNSDLQYFANLANKTEKETSNIIVTELINTKLIEDITENYGVTVREAYDGLIEVSQLDFMFEQLGVSNCISHISKVLDLVLFGDDECEKCGGVIEVTDGEYKHTYGDGWNEPKEYAPIWEETTCQVCGNKESNEPY